MRSGLSLPSRWKRRRASSGVAEEFAAIFWMIIRAGSMSSLTPGRKPTSGMTVSADGAARGADQSQGYYPGAFKIDSYAAHVRRCDRLLSIGIRRSEWDCGGIAGFPDHAADQPSLSIDRAVDAYDLVIHSPREIVGGVMRFGGKEDERTDGDYADSESGLTSFSSRFSL